MDLVTLGRTLGFSFAAGVNLYATVAILGLAARYGWVELPPQFDTFDHDIVIGVALAMYLIEFFADKIPYFDSLWDLDPHGYPTPRRGADRGRRAWRRVAGGRRAGRVGRRDGRRQQPSDEDEHPGCGEHQSRTALELVSQSWRGPLRGWVGLSHTPVPRCGARCLSWPRRPDRRLRFSNHPDDEALVRQKEDYARAANRR